MTVTTKPALPDVALVGARAAEILAAIEAGEAYDRLSKSSKGYVDCWATYTGRRCDRRPVFRGVASALVAVQGVC